MELEGADDVEAVLGEEVIGLTVPKVLFSMGRTPYWQRPAFTAWATPSKFLKPLMVRWLNAFSAAW